MKLYRNFITNVRFIFGARYSRQERREIARLKLDRSTPGRKKLKEYYKKLNEDDL